MVPCSFHSLAKHQTLRHGSGQRLKRLLLQLPATVERRLVLAAGPEWHSGQLPPAPSYGNESTALSKMLFPERHALPDLCGMPAMASGKAIASWLSGCARAARGSFWEPSPHGKSVVDRWRDAVSQLATGET